MVLNFGEKAVNEEEEVSPPSGISVVPSQNENVSK
jgi:hypothetical protein